MILVVYLPAAKDIRSQLPHIRVIKNSGRITNFGEVLNIRIAVVVIKMCLPYL